MENLTPITRKEMFLSAIAGSIANKADLDENGLIPTSELPPVVFEHMVTVANDTARFALTTADVQNGDTVYVDSTQKMYFVIDDTKLGSEQGYQEYVAGTAAKALGDEDGNNIKQTYQPKIDDQHKISADLVDDSNSTNKLVTATEKQTWNGKLDDKTTHTTINGIDVYVSNTQPTGNIAVGSIGFGW